MEVIVTWGSGGIKPHILSLCTTYIKVATDTTQSLFQSKHNIEYEAE